MKPQARFSTGAVWAAVLCIALLGGFVVWMQVDVDLLRRMSKEDSVVETCSAVLFLGSAICFFVMLTRSDFIRQRGTKSAYLFTLLWALLMVLFAGEEISWGQRLFGFSTPEALSQVNTQQEFNIHNIDFVDKFLGGKYRYLSIMMLATGLLLPLMALTTTGRRIFQFLVFPVSPLRYAWLFVGAYVFGKYYHAFPVASPSGHPTVFIATEIREFLFSVGMFCFALHGAVRSRDLFRASAAEGPAVRDTAPAAAH